MSLVFCQSGGVGHNGLTMEVLDVFQMVGMRACYLFSRLVKQLRQNLLPLLPDLVVRLQPHLVHIVSNPLPDIPPTKSAQGTPASL